MNIKELLLQRHKARLVLAPVLLMTLTGCVGYVEGPSASVYAAPPVVETAVVVPDDYVYYPNYECYYSVSRHQYAYMEGGAWVSRSAPRGVSVDVLLASPSVKMDFHDSPANHHATVVQKYPKDWKPSGSNKPQKDNRKDDARNQQGDNHGR